MRVLCRQRAFRSCSSCEVRRIEWREFSVWPSTTLQKAKSAAAQITVPIQESPRPASEPFPVVLAADSGGAISSQGDRVPAPHRDDETLEVALTRPYPHM